MAISQEELDRQKQLVELQKEQKRLQSESFDQSSLLVESLKETLGIKSKINTFDSGLIDINKKINKSILQQKTDLNSIKDLEKQITSNNRLIEDSKTLQASLQKDISKEVTLEGKTMSRAISQAKANLTVLQKKQKLLEDGTSLSSQEVDAIKNEISNREKTLANQLSSLSASGKQLLFASKNTKELEKQNAERLKQLDLEKKIEESLGVAGKLNKLIGTIPGLGESSSKALSDVTEEIRETSKVTGEVPSKAKAAAMQFKALGRNIAKDLLDPTTLALGAITAIGKTLMSVDKEAGEFAKNMGISYDESLALRGEMNKVALSNKDILITSKELIKAQSELNEFFGQSVAFSGEIASEFASIQKRTGLSTKTLGIFTRTAMESGVATEDILVNIEKTRLEQNNLNKLSLSSKQIQEGIAEASNAFQLSVGKSVIELTKAFFASKQLGASFQQLEGLADNLLDFESSIQSELQAELLTGKQLNLEKARQAALDNDLATLATEIKNQVGSAAEFGEMNRIQQEAIAKSIGMQRGELADVLMEQENINALQGIFGSGVESLSDAQKEYNKLKSEGRLTEEQTNALAEKGLADQMATASVAARFEATMMRVQELFIGLAEPILAAVDGMISLVGGAENFASALMLVAAAYLGIRGYQAISLLLTKKKKQEELQILGIKVGQATAQSIINPLAAVAGLALAATVGSLIYGAIKGDDIISKSSGLSGYGDRVLLGPEGAISLNNKDTIVAGTNLFKANDMTLSPEGTNTVVGNQDNTALITEVRTLININRQILAKSTTLEVDKQVMATTTENEMVKSNRVIQ